MIKIVLAILVLTFLGLWLIKTEIEHKEELEKLKAYMVIENREHLIVLERLLKMEDSLKVCKEMIRDCCVHGKLTEKQYKYYEYIYGSEYP